MHEGVSVEVIWMDDDLVELRVACGNGRFFGTADCYGSEDVLKALAKAISGFPRSRDDHREVEVGSLDPATAGGGVQIVFQIDPAGHAGAAIRVRSERTGTGREDGMAEFFLPVEAAAVDRFVGALRTMPLSVGARAVLTRSP